MELVFAITLGIIAIIVVTLTSFLAIAALAVWLERRGR
jgi:hypothetical protein